MIDNVLQSSNTLRLKEKNLISTPRTYFLEPKEDRVHLNGPHENMPSFLRTYTENFNNLIDETVQLN